MSAKELRQEARQCLQGKWQKVIVISIINVAISIILMLLSMFTIGIFSIVQVVITPALMYGLAYSYYHIKKGDEIGYFDFLTIGFKNFGRGWKIVWEIFKKMWWCILLIVITFVVIIGIGGVILNKYETNGIKDSSLYSSNYYNDDTDTSYYNNQYYQMSIAIESLATYLFRYNDSYIYNYTSYNDTKFYCLSKIYTVVLYSSN